MSNIEAETAHGKITSCIKSPEEIKQFNKNYKIFELNKGFAAQQDLVRFISRFKFLLYRAECDIIDGDTGPWLRSSAG